MCSLISSLLKWIQFVAKKFIFLDIRLLRKVDNFSIHWIFSWRNNKKSFKNLKSQELVMQAFLHGQIMFSVFFYRSCLWSTFWIDLSLWLYFHDLWHCILKNNWDTTGDLLVGEIFEKYQNILLAFLQIAYLSWMSRTEMARSVSLPPTILSMMRDLIPGTIS